MEPWEDELLLDDDFSDEEEDAEEQIEKTSLEMDASERNEVALGVIPNGLMNDFARFWGFDDSN